MSPLSPSKGSTPDPPMRRPLNSSPGWPTLAQFARVGPLFSRPISAHSESPATSALKSDSVSGSFDSSCRLLTVDCKLPLTPTIPAHTRPPGEGGYTGSLVRPHPVPRDAKLPFLSSRAKQPDLFPRAALGRVGLRREGPWQPSLSNPNRWHDYKPEVSIR